MKDKRTWDEMMRADGFEFDESAPPADLRERLTALRELVEACEADLCGAVTDDCPDDEAVALGEGGPTVMTFGHIRRARSALAAIGEQWRPIETLEPTPKTQPLPNYVLMFNGYHRGVGFRGEDNADFGPQFWSEAGEPIEPPPTHWQPLPPPPGDRGPEE